MNAIERHYRISLLIERMQAIHCELHQLEASIPAGPLYAESLIRFERASKGIHNVVLDLAPVPTMNDLETMLTLSIEQTRCAEIGAEHEDAEGYDTRPDWMNQDSNGNLGLSR